MENVHKHDPITFGGRNVTSTTTDSYARSYVRTLRVRIRSPAIIKSMRLPIRLLEPLLVLVPPLAPLNLRIRTRCGLLNHWPNQINAPAAGQSNQ